MSNILRKEKELIGKGKRPRIIRRQHCRRCDTVLALEITDKFGALASECWWMKGGLWLKERWFGNHVVCPKCGLEGNLPMDKPLSYETIKKREEEKANGAIEGKPVKES